MTGGTEYPLPNSPEPCEGVTLKPIRCEYIESSKFEVHAYYESPDSAAEKLESFDEQQALSNFLKQKMTDLKIVELVVKLPESKFPKQAKQFKNFVFLDLVGMIR